ncbi:DMT family transporter [Polycladidibacter stylochi]|uniref:DMT family transporter n=1 Tax=Polycladidibacter stylochi TaxID=1807766 RepID=UPI000A634C54|nr:DMT family transporter [Pseudovibrio stylochi]
MRAPQQLKKQMEQRADKTATTANNRQQSQSVAANPILGIGFKLASTLLFFIMASAVKWASETVPTTQIVFSRNFFAMIPILAVMAYGGNMRELAYTNRVGGHIMRAIIGVTAMICGFTAYSFMSLPDVTAIGFSSPLMVVVLAALILHEQVRIYRWSAVGVGFIGVMVMLSPHLGQGDETSMIGLIAAFGSAFFGACAMITVRQLCVSERASTIVLWFTVCSAIIGLMSFPLGWIFPQLEWVMPNLTELLLLVTMGIAGGIGQILLTQSYRYADASTIAPFDYVNMIWAILFGYILFGDEVSIEVLLGTAIVVASGIFVIYREKKRGYNRNRQGRASTPSKA